MRTLSPKRQKHSGTLSDKHTPVAKLALSDCKSMQETAYLLRNPHNARHLLQSIAQIDAGQVRGKTMTELDTMAQ